MTLRYKRIARYLSLMSLMLNLSPITVYVVKAFVTGAARQKFVLGITVVIAVCMTVANFMMKINLRSSIWILLLGVHVAIEKIMPLIIIIAICTIMDELIVTPLQKSYKNKYIINKEIDKRL